MVGSTGKLTISSLAMLNAGKIPGNTSVDDFNMREKQITNQRQEMVYINIYTDITCIYIYIYRYIDIYI